MEPGLLPKLVTRRCEGLFLLSIHVGRQYMQTKRKNSEKEHSVLSNHPVCSQCDQPTKSSLLNRWGVFLGSFCCSQVVIWQKAKLAEGQDSGSARLRKKPRM